ncbi:MAG: class I SAM-dependent methyltransferase [Clostridia bacterium]|nr:class I SAM-dependent methyltransferase [Clostridia bacterium]
MDYTKINAETWDRWAENGFTWTQPISHEDYLAVTADNFIVYLTPCVPVPHEWFGGSQDNGLSGKRLLGLASGGGQQMPVFAKLGADCTVFDNSERQLASEAMVAEREGYKIEILRGDMTKPLPFADATFDIIFHPVSNCYIEDVQHVWNECYRILKPGGVLLAGMDNGMNFLFAEDEAPLVVVNRLPFNPLKMPKEQVAQMLANDDGIQFSHTLEEQIGGQLKAGFILRALYEDRDRPGCGVIREYCPQYFATLAVKG